MQNSIFRLSPVYGIGQYSEIYVNGKYYKAGIQTFIEKAISGETIEIWENPHISRDIVYVKDVDKAFSLILKSNDANGLYNMTASMKLDLTEQVETIIDVFSAGKKSKIKYRPDKKNNTPLYINQL